MTAAVRKRSSVSASLQLFQPDASGSDEAPDQIRLGEAFTRFLEPDVVANRAKGTLTQFQVTIGHWERLTDDPPLAAINNTLLIAFRTARLADKYDDQDGRRNATVNKDLRTLRAILRRVGPPTDRNPFGQGILSTVPCCQMLEKQSIRKRYVTRMESGAIYTACEIARWPLQEVTGMHPVKVWQLMIAIQDQWGMNIGDMRRLDAEESFVRGNGKFPTPVKGRLYLRYLRQKTRGKKPEPIVIPVSRTMLLHLKPFLKRGGNLLRLPKNNRDYKKQRDAIMSEAGIADRVTFQNFRQTCSSKYNELDPGLGPVVLGHAPRGVNAEFYAIDVKRLHRGVKKFDRKKAPKKMRATKERQKRFF